MGTVILRPQDFWTDQFRLPHPEALHRRRSYYPNSRSHRKPSLPRSERPDQRRKSPSPSPPLSPIPQSQPHPLLIPTSPAPLPRRSSSADELQAYYNNRSAAQPQMGRVRIPRRRQSLDTIDATRMKRDMNNIARGGLIKKKYMDEDDVYAGSAFFVSPSPSSLPLPSFFNNNTVATNNSSSSSKIVPAMGNDHDLATRDLRRLLRLE